MHVRTLSIFYRGWVRLLCIVRKQSYSCSIYGIGSCEKNRITIAKNFIGILPPPQFIRTFSSCSYQTVLLQMCDSFCSDVAGDVYYLHFSWIFIVGIVGRCPPIIYTDWTNLGGTLEFGSNRFWFRKDVWKMFVKTIRLLCDKVLNNGVRIFHQDLLHISILWDVYNYLWLKNSNTIPYKILW